MRITLLITAFGICGVALAGFSNKPYPTYENGANVSLSDRPLQALNVGTTFKLPRFANSLNFIGGIHDEKGEKVYGTPEGPYCFIHEADERLAPVDLPEEKRDVCMLREIEGLQSVDAAEKNPDYWTRLKLVCRESVQIEISCHRPAEKSPVEMTLGQFERILSKKFQFGNLKLETPLVEMTTGYPAESPVTPQQILSGYLRFELQEPTPMAFADFGESSGKGYKGHLAKEKLSNDYPEGSHTTVIIKTGKELAKAPNSSDVNGMNVTNVTIGYSKTHFRENDQSRNSFLLIRGTKKIAGTDTEITLHWTDDDNSHVTYESMWQVPGRSSIRNWYQIGF